MKNKIFQILMIALIAMPISAHAADEANLNTNVSIAVVDVQQLMAISDAAKSIKKQAGTLRDKYQSKLKKIESKLKETENTVVEAGKEQDKEKFLENRKKFQKELVDAQKKMAEMNASLDKAVGEALNTLRDEIVQIVGDMSAERGYDLVISRNDVVIVSKKIDITAEVMKKLNKSLSTVKVKD